MEEQLLISSRALLAHPSSGTWLMKLCFHTTVPIILSIMLHSTRFQHEVLSVDAPICGCLQFHKSDMWMLPKSQLTFWKRFASGAEVHHNSVDVGRLRNRAFAVVRLRHNGRRPQVPAGPLCISRTTDKADYTASVNDSSVLRLPPKQELTPQDVMNVFGYAHNLHHKCAGPSGGKGYMSSISCKD